MPDRLGTVFDEQPPLVMYAGRTLLINQMIALPVALVLTAAGGSFGLALAVATIYSQTIGVVCAIVVRGTSGWLRSMGAGAKRAAVMAQFFLSGAAGAEIARRLCASLLGETFTREPAIVSWAIGASIALIVGAVLTTVRHLRSRVVSTELDALQARINPHFLFNTLNSIAALIREDPQRAEAMTLRLSSLFRYTLQAPRRGRVTLEEELAIVEGYLAIEQERLAERLQYRLEIDQSLLVLRVPPLLVQPLVENAIKHGVADAVSGGTIVVRGWQEGPIVHISVENSAGAGVASPGTGEGLDNVRRRLQGTFGRKASLTLRHLQDRTEARLSFAAEAEP